MIPKNSYHTVITRARAEAVPLLLLSFFSSTCTQSWMPGKMLQRMACKRRNSEWFELSWAQRIQRWTRAEARNHGTVSVVLVSRSLFVGEHGPLYMMRLFRDAGCCSAQGKLNQKKKTRLLVTACSNILSLITKVSKNCLKGKSYDFRFYHSTTSS